MTPTLALPPFAPPPQRAQLLEFWLPMPPKVTNNAKAHWGAQHREVTRYLRELNWRAMAKFNIPPVPYVPISPARLEACFYFKNRHHFMDRDNRTARLKRVIDWFVNNRYLAGDSDEHVTYEIPRQEIVTGTEPDLCSLHITIGPA